MNEVIRAILDFLIQKFHKHKKAQSAYKRTKIKNAPTSTRKIVTYSLICVLCFCLSAFVLFSAFSAFCARENVSQKK